MMNIGKNPTVNGVGLKIEVHIFNFDEEIYGESLKINLDNLPNILSSQDLNWQASILDYLRRYNRENSETAKLLFSSKSSVMKSDKG